MPRIPRIPFFNVTFPAQRLSPHTREHTKKTLQVTTPITSHLGTMLSPSVPHKKKELLLAARLHEGCPRGPLLLFPAEWFHALMIIPFIFSCLEKAPFYPHDVVTYTTDSVSRRYFDLPFLRKNSCVCLCELSFLSNVVKTCPLLDDDARAQPPSSLLHLFVITP